MYNIELSSAVTAFTRNTTTYEHLHTQDVNINNPAANNLDCSPQNVGSGFNYKTGIDQPVVTTLTLRHISEDLRDMLVDCYNTGERLDFIVYSRTNNNQYTMDEAIIQNDPRNTSIQQGAETFNVQITLHCTQSNYDAKTE